MKLAKIASLWIDGPLGWIENASLTSFVRLGHDVTLFTYGTISNAPEGVTVRDAREIWANDTITIHQETKSPAIHFDIFRAVLAANTNFVWVSPDIIALRPFPASLKWFIGFERNNLLNIGVMGFPRSSETAKKLADALTQPHPIPGWFSKSGKEYLQKLYENGNSIDWTMLPLGATGAVALNYFANETGEIKHAQPAHVFFPVNFPSRKMLVDGKNIPALERHLEDTKPLSVPLYSHWMRKFTGGGLPKENSWIGQYLVDNGLADPEQMPKPKNKGRGAPVEKPVDTEVFFDDLAARKAKYKGSHPRPRNGNLVAVTMAKDEGPYVLEWVAYHHLLGFSDILVYTNDCTDGTDEMLDALASIGLLTRVDNSPLGTMPPQSRALKRAQIHPLVRHADWVMVFDFDEFLTIQRGAKRVDDLVDMVKENDATAVAVTWRFFGSNGNACYEDQPVTTRFTRSAETSFAKGYGVKTLFQNSDALTLAIHRPRLKKKLPPDKEYKLNWINGSAEKIDGQIMSWRQTRHTSGYDFCQVNHYGVKSGEEYLMRRLRGDVLNNHGKYDDEYFNLFDRNEVNDRSASSMENDLHAMIEELLKYPKISKAAKLVKKRYHEKLSLLRKSEGYSEQLEKLGFSI